MNWFIVNTCALYGIFQAKPSAGTYSLTLSYCLQVSNGAGCPNATSGIQSCKLPIAVVVEPGKVTRVSLGITTGIY